MKEIQLHELLIAYPHLVEEGCIFLDSEVNLNGKRCDLLFLDKSKRKLYVEVKLKVDDRAVGQLIRYDGLVNNPDARFMLVGLSIVAGLEEGLKKHGYEYKEINLEDSTVEKDSVTIYQKKLPRSKSKFQTSEDLFKTFNSYEKSIAEEIFNHANSLSFVYYYITDGIMFRRATRKYKFLSITTKGNRVLFHVPVKRRIEIFDLFKEKVDIYLPNDPRDINQIDIEIKKIKF